MASSRDEWEGQQEVYLAAMQDCKWIPLAGEHPMMQGLGIQAVIRELRMPKVSCIAYNVLAFAPYGFYGVHAHYKNATVRAYFLDMGTHIKSIAQEVQRID